ncbi:hypothetical protein D3C78_1874980 [compost metagenome]
MSIIIERNVHLVQLGSFNCKGEQMMTVFRVELLTSKTVNTADDFCILITICEQCSLNLVHHITTMSPI